MKQIKATGSHFEVGFSIGQYFSSEIQKAIAENITLQETFLPFHRSPEGQNLYEQLLSIHRKEYPDFMAEIEGIARGAVCAFEDLFLMNMRGEYRGYVSGKNNKGCSTLSLLNDEHAIFGHNEDGSLFYKDSMYVVEAHVTGKPPFTAFSYPGFLCGNAFGFNSEGICFCNNDVTPETLKVGRGRHFMARALFEAATIEAAVEAVIPSGRAGGFNYTIGSVKQRRIVNVEVSPDRHRVVEIYGTDYRANHYLDLQPILQTFGESSRCRVERATALLDKRPPAGKTDVLALLSDGKDPDYPIFRTGLPPDDIATLATCIFDLDAGNVEIHTGHPIDENNNSLEFSMIRGAS
jgi:predicted choloylglycine hydrolase